MTNPLRILSNDRNLLRTATLTPSSVEPADNTAIAVEASRSGSAPVALTGSYTGFEDATIDIQIADLTADTKRASAPVLIGAGSGTLTDIAATTPFAAQTVTVALKDAGIPIISASLDFEGVKLVSTHVGADGNLTHIHIDQEPSPGGLVYTPSNFSLLTDLKAGQGGTTSGLSGAAFDWDTAVLGVDDIIPSSAHRISFGDDRTVYLQYKKFTAGAWQYFFVPALLRDIPADTRINFVTGGRTVTLSDDTTSPPSVEEYTGIQTRYDLLHALREDSALVTIDGIVANDRSPTGQAALDLNTRTDAHAEPSFGTGSRFATGFENVTVAEEAGTERVVARCYAITANDHPLAHLTKERWQVKSVLRGALADAITGVRYITDDWAWTIPTREPPGYGTVQHGEFSVVAINYASRLSGESEPPICPVLAPLGPNAADQTITLVYEARPVGNCGCEAMPKPRWSSFCLGIEPEGGPMTYSTDARTRLEALYAYAKDCVDAVTSYSTGKARSGVLTGFDDAEVTLSNSASGGESTMGRSVSVATSGYTDFVAPGPLVDATYGEFGLPADIQTLFDTYELAIQQLDELDAGADKTAGWDKWDAALQSLIDDLDSPPSVRIASVASDKYRVLLRGALAYAGISPLGKSESSILVSGDGCWTDYGDSAWWRVSGDVGGGYAPLFTNHPYYSSRRTVDGGKFYSTHEFGLQLNVKCPGDLKLGDTVTLKIGNASWPSTYQVGDELILPVIAAHDLYLAGGQDGTTVQKWNVTGASAGPMPQYVLDTSSPSPYSSGGLGLQINQGGVPFKVGDEFRFAIEGGHFKWRLNAGAWSGLQDIPDGAVLLYAGLSADFGAGNAPSFAVDDLYSFRVQQPRRASNLQTPGPEAWKWASDASPPDATPYLLMDLGSSQNVGNFALALHTLPAGCTLTLEGAAALASPWAADWTETLTRVEGPIYAEFGPHAARYLRLTIADADGAVIGYAYSGAALSTELSAELDPLSRVYKILRGTGGIYQGGKYLGKAVSGDLTWKSGVSSDEIEALTAMVDYVKLHDDQPIIIVPSVERPEQAFLGQVGDRIDWPDNLAARTPTTRRYPFALPVTGAYFR